MVSGPVQPSVSITKSFSVQATTFLNKVPGLPVCRFLNKHASTHFYTVSESERENVIANLSQWYQYEGVAFYGRTDKPGGFLPVYRFWLAGTASHYFTISEDEREYLIRYSDPNYIQYEGVAWYAQPLRE